MTTKSDEYMSVVMPIYNEANLLRDRIPVYCKKLNKLIGENRWEFLLINNGSTDNSELIINELGQTYSGIKQHMLDKPNIGRAYKHALEHCNYSYVYVVELDQWDDPFLSWSWKYRRDYDLITSSKRADPSINEQPIIRFILTWGLNCMLQLLFSFPGSDAHGQKLVYKPSFSNILENTRADRGQWEVEFVVRALKSGKRIVELPVPYVEMRPPRNTLIKKIIWNVWALTKLARRLRSTPYSSVRLRKISRSDVEAGVGFPSEGQ